MKLYLSLKISKMPPYIGSSVISPFELKHIEEVIMENKRMEELDKEWLQLVEEFMKSNISKNEFRVFLELKKIEKENKKKEQ